jgi:hypothetical protein
MNIKVNKKMARLLVLRILLKEIISSKQVSYYHLLKEKRLSPDSLPFFLFLKLGVTWSSWKRNDIAYISHPCNELNHALKPKTES